MTLKQSTFRPPHGWILNLIPAEVCRANHIGVFRDSGLDVKRYRYYDEKTISLDLNGMIEDIKVYRNAKY